MLVATTSADEIMVSTVVPVQSERVASYERVAKLWALPNLQLRASLRQSHSALRHSRDGAARPDEQVPEPAAEAAPAETETAEPQE